MSTPNRKQVSRRAMLYGTGVAMALPWLESIPVWGSEAHVAGQYPKRFAALFMANGVNPDRWTATGSGLDMQLGECLQPLEPFKAKMNFITGLFNKAATGVGIHPGQTGNLLSGVRLQKGSELKGGISMDQVLANKLGQETAMPSLVLGCEQPVTGYHETNFSMAYGSHISWRSATSPVPMEVYPSLAFDSLFDNRGSLRNRSILDRVQEEANDLNRRISRGDRSKLEEYLTSVREVEQRIDRMRVQADKAASKAQDKGASLSWMARPDNGLPEDIREHMQMMCDIIAIAFQTDKTRIATLLMCRDISGLFYPFLDVRMAHHAASHRDTSDDYAKIVNYYCGQVAYLAQRLESMQEGDGTVLDHSCLIFLSNMWSGSQHDSTKLPVLTLGGLNGTIKTGRVMDYAGRDDEQRKLCSLYLSVMDRMEVREPSFGDATDRLADF